MNVHGAQTARKPVRAVVVAADDAETSSWLECVREELSGGDVPVMLVPSFDGNALRDALAAAFANGLALPRDERDPVTGLPQRPAFERFTQHALGNCDTGGCTVAVLFVDVDRFHVVNELGDHAAGDAILREIAARLRGRLPDAFVSRFGGDEFVLLSVEDAPEAAREAADAASACFAAPFWVAGTPVHLTASIGVARAPIDAYDVAGLIGSAEAAVFEAKRLGRNTVRWYRPPGTTSSLERVLTRRDLNGAIERGEFELHYQPMYDLGSGSVRAVEALLRWRHPVRGMMPPDRFIPIAEEFGLIEELGAWALDAAIAQMRSWIDAGLPAIPVSVNVSARQLDGGAFPELVARLLAHHDVPASSLEIEITESAIMRDVEAAAQILHALRALGVRISIDDFGTGYTSLGFLKRFPVDVVKIDRSFVTDIVQCPFDAAIVRAVTTLARALNLCTVAEGVETPEQRERLRALDCDVVQGFLFCRPLAASALTPLLAARPAA